MSQSDEEAPWIAIAERKKRDQEALIPAAWRIPHDALPQDPPKLEYGHQNVVDLPREFLSRTEISITESYSVPALLTAISTRRLSAVEVATAFCHRAAIAQQLTNCLTEILFESCIERAKELDAYLSKYRRPIGPLHGLPITFKDTFNIKGVDSSLGVTALCYKPAAESASLVDMLLSLGCVIVAKTNVPQTLNSLDSYNHVFGRTMNPISRVLAGGGSSGGEGVITAMKGNMIGWGTDIGGSIRIPAAHNGVYAFKPSQGRVPYSGQSSPAAPGTNRMTIQPSAGPFGRSVEDLELVMSEIAPRAKLWGEDCVASFWSGERTRGSGPNGEFVIGVLRSDGKCKLLPPITRLMDEVADRLRKTPGFRVIELATPKAWTNAPLLMRQIRSAPSVGNMMRILKETEEPLVPWFAARYKGNPPVSLEQLAEFQAQRTQLEREMLKMWVSEDEFGRRRRRIDAVILPVAPHPVPEIDKYDWVGFTSSWNLHDYPAGVIPVRDFVETDLELGKPFDDPQILSELDKKNRDLWDESKTARRAYLGGPLSIQVVTSKAEDETLMTAMKMIDEALDGNIHQDLRARLYETSL